MSSPIQTCIALVLQWLHVVLLIRWIGLDWIGLDWIGLDWIGLDWIGLDWIGLDWMCLVTALWLDGWWPAGT